MEYSGILSQDLFAFFAISKIRIEVMPPEITPPKPRIFMNDADLRIFIRINKNITGTMVRSQDFTFDIL